MRIEAWKTRRCRESVCRSRGQRPTAQKVSSSKGTPCARALGGSDHRAACACRDYRWIRLPFRASDPRSASAIVEKSIAVLPFENLSEDKANAYFADGIQDEILTRLSKIADLKVISRTSTQHYKSAPENLSEIARQLGVAHILEGRVQKSGDPVRVNVQLIKADTDSHLWAETYDRNLDDIFSVESEVATAIAQKLQAKLTGSEQRELASKPTVNLDAYDAYLHGIEFDRRTESWADLLEAKRYLELAVKLDPTFALAWARLGRVEANIYFQDIDIRPARADAARNAVETAVRLQPGLGESWLASGYYHLYCERNRTLARAAFEKALQSLPNDSDVLSALSIVDRSQGQPRQRVGLASRSPSTRSAERQLVLPARGNLRCVAPVRRSACGSG